MKSKDEILNLIPDELNKKMQVLQEEMENLQLQKATHQIANPMRIRQVRRNIARIKTLITEYQKGIRNIEKKENN
jgi:large subunit ribosomal protein L29